MEHNSAWPLRLAYLYLALPVAIFFAGWLRWYFAAPLLALLAWGLIRAMMDAPAVWLPEKGKKALFTFFACTAIILVAVVLSGVGGFMFQNRDHYWRNAIFDALLKYDWPVMDVNSAGKPVMLVYYIGFWLPAALVGKAFGAVAGYIFMALWAAIGVGIVWSLICAKLKCHSVMPLILFFCFSGLDLVILLLKGVPLTWTTHLEWTLDQLQYSSFTTQLFWVFNQALPAWVMTMALLLEDKNRHMVFLLSLALINCTLPFAGMLPIAATVALTRPYGDKKGAARWRAWFKDTFTWSNVLCGGVIGIVGALYVTSNSRASSTGDSTVGTGPIAFVWQRYDSFFGFLVRFGVFLLFEVLLYFLLTYKYERKKPLFWVSLGSLCVIPLIVVGTSNDFCMRASIPALMILYLMVAESLEMAYNNKDYKILIPLLLCLVIGASTPAHEVIRSVSETAKGNTWAGSFPLMKSETDQNFVAEVEDSLFYRYIARR